MNSGSRKERKNGPQKEDLRILYSNRIEIDFHNRDSMPPKSI